MAYDTLGRLTARNEPDLISNWYYDTTAPVGTTTTTAGTSCGPAGKTTKGELCETTTSTGYRRVNQFDSYNRIIQSTTKLDAGSAYVSKIAYDANARISQQTWPTGLAAANVYDSLGTLTEMRLAPSNQLVWQRGANNARGQFTSVTYGNNIQTRHTYEEQTGLLSLHQAGPANAPSQNTTIDQRYHYNPLGHVVVRHDVIHAAHVSFLYSSDHQRIREVSSQTTSGPTGSVTTQKSLAVLHPDNAGALYFERETINTGPDAGTVQNRHYLTAEKGAFLLITSNSSLQANPTATNLANAEQRYWHKDLLGSIVASTRASPSPTPLWPELQR